MNSLLFYPFEATSSSRFIIQGERATTVIESHQLVTGLSLKAALLGGRRGTATVVDLHSERVILEATLTLPPPIRPQCDLIVAVPRPQTVKKVLQLAASFGVNRVDFIKSKRSEKNYLQSKSLRPSAIEHELFLGAQQAFDCILPTVQITQSFSELATSHLTPKTEDGLLRLFAHGPDFFDSTKRSSDLTHIPQASLSVPITLAIGPESGWSPEEIAWFQESGFHRISLGERMYRIEHALAMLLGQVLAARTQR